MSKKLTPLSYLLHYMDYSPNRLKELQNIPDTAIDTSDIPELDQQFWETAKMVKPVSQEIYHQE